MSTELELQRYNAERWRCSYEEALATAEGYGQEVVRLRELLARSEAARHELASVIFVPPGYEEAEGEVIEFEVDGDPAPAGSKTSFALPSGSTVTTDKAKRGDHYTALVAIKGGEAMAGRPPLSGPVRLTLTFFQARPKGHYGQGRNAGKVRPSAPQEHTQKPDLLKLARRVEDALSGICYGDDRAIVSEVLAKRWSSRSVLKVELQVVGPTESAEVSAMLDAVVEQGGELLDKAAEEAFVTGPPADASPAF